VALRQVDDRRLVEPFAGGTSVEQRSTTPPRGLSQEGKDQWHRIEPPAAPTG